MIIAWAIGAIALIGALVVREHRLIAEMKRRRVALEASKAQSEAVYARMR